MAADLKRKETQNWEDFLIQTQDRDILADDNEARDSHENQLEILVQKKERVEHRIETLLAQKEILAHQFETSTRQRQIIAEQIQILLQQKEILAQETDTLQQQTDLANQIKVLEKQREIIVDQHKILEEQKAKFEHQIEILGQKKEMLEREINERTGILEEESDLSPEHEEIEFQIQTLPDERALIRNQSEKLKHPDETMAQKKNLLSQKNKITDLRYQNVAAEFEQITKRHSFQLVSI